MKTGIYVSTKAKNLREYNKNEKKFSCSSCGRDDAAQAAYIGYQLNDPEGPEILSPLHKVRAYVYKCKFCGHQFGPPFKIYFNDPNAPD